MTTSKPLGADDSVRSRSDAERANRTIPPAECTEHPWWAIVDPRQVFALTDGRGVASVAQCITGPYFSREAAEEQLRARRHAYGPHAGVWCFGGYMSPDWRTFCEKPKSSDS